MHAKDKKGYVMLILFIFISAILFLIRDLWPPKVTDQDIENLVKIREIEFLWNQLSEKQKKELENEIGI